MAQWKDNIIDRVGYSGSAEPANQGMTPSEDLEVGLANFDVKTQIQGGTLLRNYGDAIKIYGDKFLFGTTLDYRFNTEVEIASVTDNDVNFPAIATSTLFPVIEKKMLPLETGAYKMPLALNLFSEIIDIISHIPATEFDPALGWSNDDYTYTASLECANNFRIDMTYSFRLNRLPVAATAPLVVTMSNIQWFVQITGLGTQSTQTRRIDLQTNRYTVTFTNAGRPDLNCLSMVTIAKTASKRDTAPQAATDPIILQDDATFPTSTNYTNSGTYFSCLKGGGSTDTTTILQPLNKRFRKLVDDGRGPEFIARWISGFSVLTRGDMRSVIVTLGDAWRTGTNVINLGQIGNTLNLKTNALDVPPQTNISDIYQHNAVYLQDLMTWDNLCADTEMSYLTVDPARIANPQLNLTGYTNLGYLRILHPVLAFFNIVKANFDTLSANLTATGVDLQLQTQFASTSFNATFIWRTTGFKVVTSNNVTTISGAMQMYLDVSGFKMRFAYNSNPNVARYSITSTPQEDGVPPIIACAYQTTGWLLDGTTTTISLAQNETFNSVPTSSVWSITSANPPSSATTVLNTLHAAFDILLSTYNLYEAWFGLFWVTGIVPANITTRGK
jgi:hypothetical protein